MSAVWLGSWFAQVASVTDKVAVYRIWKMSACALTYTDNSGCSVWTHCNLFKLLANIPKNRVTIVNSRTNNGTSHHVSDFISNRCTNMSTSPEDISHYFTELVFVFGSCNCNGHFQALVPISWRLRVPKIIIIVNELLTGLPIKGGTFETQLYGEITLSNWRKLKLLNKVRELDGIVNSKPLVFRQCHKVECQTLDEYRTIGVMTKYV